MLTALSIIWIVFGCINLITHIDLGYYGINETTIPNPPNEANFMFYKKKREKAYWWSIVSTTISGVFFCLWVLRWGYLNKNFEELALSCIRSLSLIVFILVTIIAPYLYGKSFRK